MKFELLHTEKLICHNRKVFFLDLQENERGRVVNITEDVNAMRDHIMVPLEDLGEFIAALVAVGRAANEMGATCRNAWFALARLQPRFY